MLLLDRLSLHHHAAGQYIAPRPASRRFRQEVLLGICHILQVGTIVTHANANTCAGRESCAIKRCSEKKSSQVGSFSERYEYTSEISPLDNSAWQWEHFGRLLGDRCIFTWLFHWNCAGFLITRSGSANNSTLCTARWPRPTGREHHHLSGVAGISLFGSPLKTFVRMQCTYQRLSGLCPLFQTLARALISFRSSNESKLKY